MKKLKSLMILLFIIALLTTFGVIVSAKNFTFFCMQETANVSADCFTNNNGTYGYNPGDNWGTGGIAPLFDGNYTTFASPPSTYQANFSMNYTIPIDAYGAKWQFKDRCNFTNVSIPNNCFNKTSGRLRLFVWISNNAVIGLRTDWKCINNSDEEQTLSVCSDNEAYEEAIFWNNTVNFYLDNCSNTENLTGNATAMNISFYNQNKEPETVGFDTTIKWEVKLNYTSYTSQTITDNYSMNSISLKNVSLCIYPDNYNFTSDIHIDYTDTDDNIYSYFLYQNNLNNQTQTLNLYTQNGTSQVLFIVVDTNNDPVEDAYIHILKYDVGTGTYTATEVIKTDTEGQAIGNVVLLTTFYNFLVYYGGALVYSQQAVKLTTTTRTFNVNLLSDDWYGNYETTLGIYTNLYFNDTNNNFVFTWTDSSASMHMGCMRVDKKNQTGLFTLYDNCSESTSATIVYNIATLENGTEYVGTAYMKYDLEYIVGRVSHLVRPVFSFFRQDPQGSLFLAALMNIALVCIGLPVPALALAFLVLGTIITSLLGMWQLTVLSIGSIIILACIQIYLGSQKTK